MTGPISSRTTTYTYPPLTKSWSPPSSCASPTLTVGAGYCEYGYCTAQYDITAPAYGWVNWPEETASKAYSSTNCVPPGWNVADGVYSPATGCPKQYSTAKTGTNDYLSTDLIVLCCSSSYYISSTVTYVDGEYDTLYSCTRVSAMDSGDPFVAVAWGYNTVNNPATPTKSLYYYTESIISTGHLTAALAVTIAHPAVTAVVPTRTQMSSPTATATGTSKRPFSLFNLSFMLSIIVLPTGVVDVQEDTSHHRSLGLRPNLLPDLFRLP
ncbi:hypothetical protein TWF694_001385 [Orbilia ellipsospora]|uniref:Uncharacterized protein n=1 Tax=Orbilia ellipsospora TaxID=2528407 RepID=A0AAV9XRV0_9PEZI